ncbi:hypothetical protein [Kordiimonas aquimaris]|uniref:hypothetical protein n=1 Tax=Kordiimonas aquimaris TaxID=707591 RepID=UPI0021D10C1A|nr:hypothetical protein [Kordiimonas aquimaris]
MPSVHTFVYQQAMRAVLLGALPGFGGAGLSAHLMTPAFVPDQIGQETFADIASHEITGFDYSPRPVNGIAVIADNGSWSLATDAIIFGDPVTVPPFRFLVMAYGSVAAPASSKQLLICVDLNPSGNALEAINGVLKIETPPAGWLTITSS